jgi:hypothetical protein
MTKLQSALSAVIIGATLAAMVSPASACWQVVANSPNGQRQVSPHYSSQKDCKSALKATETRLAKKYPELYPLVGSCEEYR